MKPDPDTGDTRINTSAQETLRSLKQMREVLRNPADDIRSRRIVDADGKPLGHIHGLLVDDQENKVRFLDVASGGFLGIGAARSLVPVEAITQITEHLVTVNQTRERLAGAPVYDPDLIKDNYYEDIYNYTPYWGAGYLYPSYPDYP